MLSVRFQNHPPRCQWRCSRCRSWCPVFAVFFQQSHPEAKNCWCNFECFGKWPGGIHLDLFAIGCLLLCALADTAENLCACYANMQLGEGTIVELSAATWSAATSILLPSKTCPAMATRHHGYFRPAQPKVNITNYKPLFLQSYWGSWGWCFLSE